MERHLDDGCCDKTAAVRSNGSSSGEINHSLTPAKTQETFPDEPGANLPCDCHVGLPGFCKDPAEGGEEEKVQEGSCHDAHTLMMIEKKRATGVVFNECGLPVINCMCKLTCISFVAKMLINIHVNQDTQKIENNYIKVD